MEEESDTHLRQLGYNATGKFVALFSPSPASFYRFVSFLISKKLERGAKNSPQFLHRMCT
jgi:hypothetical protein